MDKPLVDMARNESPDPGEYAHGQNSIVGFDLDPGPASRRSVDGRGQEVNNERTPFITCVTGDEEALLFDDIPEASGDPDCARRLSLSREDSRDVAPAGQSMRTLGAFAGVYCPVS